jgi:CheY-like chemotaxis protein
MAMMIQMSRPKILLVDDNRHFLELEKEFLKQCAVMIYTASTGREALDVVSVVGPDLIFLDLFMPEMDGDLCCAAIKAEPDLRSIPVVMITSAGKAEDHARCLSAGCDGIMVKPVDRKTFIEYGHRFLPRIDTIEFRAPCRTQATFEIGGRCFYGAGINLSTAGMFISSDAPVAVEDRVTLSFFLSGDQGGVIERRGVSHGSTPGEKSRSLRVSASSSWKFPPTEPGRSGDTSRPSRCRCSTLRMPISPTPRSSRLLKNSHLVAVLSKVALCGVALLRLRGTFCGWDDLSIFEQPVLSKSFSVTCQPSRPIS